MLGYALLWILIGMAIPVVVALVLSLRSKLPSKKLPQATNKKNIVVTRQASTQSSFDDPTQRDMELLMPIVARHSERIDSQDKDIERMLKIMADLKTSRRYAVAAARGHNIVVTSTQGRLVYKNVTQQSSVMSTFPPASLPSPAMDALGGNSDTNDIDETENSSIEYVRP